MALDGRLNPYGKVWQDLPDELVQRKAKALREAAKSLADECNFWRFCQWCFDEQWMALKRYANERSIRVVGDMPIFVSAHSADVWAHQRLFDLDASGHPRVIAGVPPDYFSATGQRWGKPALPLGRTRERRLRLVDGTAAPCAQADRHRANRPFPRIRIILGNPGYCPDRHRWTLASRSGTGAFRRDAQGAGNQKHKRPGRHQDHRRGSRCPLPPR